MAIMDSKTGTIRKSYSVTELEDAARLMRGYDLISLYCSGSGHAGGTLSIMDITAALYLRVASMDPENPLWADRDRIIWSTGHKAPSLYIGLGMAGFFNVEDVVTLRKLYSPFQGHPHWLKLDGVEASTGSLGQGLSISVGIALAALLDKKNYYVYTITGDGEHQEGQMWEAVMEAGHYKLDRLINIVDKNRLQIDGFTKDVMDIDPLKEKYESFNWNVLECNGHDMKDILDTFQKAKANKGKPTLIIAQTVKGKGVDFMEDVAGWHGRTPNKEELEKSLAQLGLTERIPLQKLIASAEKYQKEVEVKLNAKMPKFKRDFWWNSGQVMKVDMDPTRVGFGRGMEKCGDDPRIVALGADISGSINIKNFYDKHPERKSRFLSMGIAEQSATSVAAGLAKEGKLPVFGTYGCFSTGRNLDQIRTTVCYGNFNVFIIGAHGGVSVGPDGATHQALEELFLMTSLPNMHVAVPCDSIETERLTEYMLFKVVGPKFIRFAREATPIVTTMETPLVWGKANIIRYRGENARFIDAFETVLADKYENEYEDGAILACGPSVPEAMRAAWILKEEYGIETRVLNFHTVKPLDREAILRAALETRFIVTVEEHQVGGFGNWVCSSVLQEKEVYGKPLIAGMIGVKDRFGESGNPWELVKEFEVSAEHVAIKAKELYDFCAKGIE